MDAPGSNVDYQSQGYFFIGNSSGQLRTSKQVRWTLTTQTPEDLQNHQISSWTEQWRRASHMWCYKYQAYTSGSIDLSGSD